MYENIRNKKKILFFFILFTILLSIDLLSKLWVERNLSEKYTLNKPLIKNEIINKYDELIISREIIVIDPYWTFLYTRNYNIGFSLLSFLENILTKNQMFVFIQTLQSLAVIFFFYIFFSGNLHYWLPFSFILAGGMGNVLDRLFRGYVVDFIKWSVPEIPLSILNPWPIFNLADVFVSIGGGIIFLSIIRIMFKNN